ITAHAFANGVGQMVRDPAAEQHWQQIYPELSEGRAGLTGAMLARAEAQVMRLACIYALLDSSNVVTIEHLSAAGSLWRYTEASVRYIYGPGVLGDPTADKIAAAVRANGAMRRTAVHALFSRNTSGAEINRALGLLHADGLVELEETETGGRPARTWRLTKKTKKGGAGGFLRFFRSRRRPWLG